MNAPLFQSIDIAHNTMKPGRIYRSRGQLEDSSLNRSPHSYLNNPEDERHRCTEETLHVYSVPLMQHLNTLCCRPLCLQVQVEHGQRRAGAKVHRPRWRRHRNDQVKTCCSPQTISSLKALSTGFDSSPCSPAVGSPSTPSA